MVEFDDDLTYEDLCAAEQPKAPSAPTQSEVRANFYTQVILPEIEKMYGWSDSTADIAVRAIFDSTVRLFVMNPDNYISELDGFEYNGTKIVFNEPKVMVHLIYSGVQLDGDSAKVHQAVCSASHFTTTNTNRCGDNMWHTHQLVAMPIKWNQSKHTYELKEDARTIRVRHYRHFVRTFGRRHCLDCVGLSSSTNRTRLLRCTSKACGKYVKYNGKWNIQAIL